MKRKIPGAGDEYDAMVGMSEPRIPNVHVFGDVATVIVPSPPFGKSGDLHMDSEISFDVDLETAKRLIGSDVRVIVTICEGGDA